MEKNEENIYLKIKLELMKKGISQKFIAEELEVTEGTISLFINGKRKSRRFNEWVKHNLRLNLNK